MSDDDPREKSIRRQMLLMFVLLFGCALLACAIIHYGG